MNKRQTALFGLSAFATLIAAQPLRPVIVEGESMAPTYEPGALVLASRRVGQLHKNDVVVIRRDDHALIKRVAYLGGERFTEYQIADTWFEPGTASATRVCRLAGYPSRTITIPHGRIYVLGDNDGASVDSRLFGPIPKEDVVMRVVDAKPKVSVKALIGGTPPRVLDGAPISSIGITAESAR